MISDAPELIEQVLAAENDSACQRNAFVVLAQTEPNRASAYFDSIAYKIDSLDSQLQISLIEFMLGDASIDPEKRSKYTKCLFGLVSSSTPSSMVKYEACTALMALSGAPHAIKAIASCYIEMAIKEADNNAKLLILARLAELQLQHSAIVNEGILDVLRVLSTSDSEVRRRAIKLVLNGMSKRIAEEMVGFFRKELTKLRDTEGDKPIIEYKKELLKAIHVCSGKFSETNVSAISCWIEFLSDPDAPQAPEAASFIKEALEKSSDLCEDTVSQLCEAIKNVNESQICQVLFWTIAEFSCSHKNVEAAFDAIKDGLGELPMVEAEERFAANEDALNEDQLLTSKPGRKVLADGTYATENAFSSTPSQGKKDGRYIPSLKKLLLAGHHSVGASISMALSKMLLKLEGLFENPSRINFLKGQVLLVSTSILRLGLSRFPSVPIDQDTYERIMLCIRVLSKPDASMEVILSKSSGEAFSGFMKQKGKLNSVYTGEMTKITEPINFRLVSALNQEEKVLPADFAQKDLAMAVEESTKVSHRLASSLSKVVQLTGFSDSIYAETYVIVNQSDIVLDILLVNQTAETIQNLTIDLATTGDLKVVEKPAPINLTPNSFAAPKVAIKVTSTNNGMIYGCLTYGTVEPRSVVLANIAVDIVDYIHPAPLEEAEFRQHWVVLEWENKINIPTIKVPQTRAQSKEILKTFLEDLLRHTHLTCITPALGLCEGGDYLAANMFARSVFNEDVLANICLERSSPEEVTGHVRLRSKTQGIAIALGDKINAFVQKYTF